MISVDNMFGIYIYIYIYIYIAYCQKLYPINNFATSDVKNTIEHNFS